MKISTTSFLFLLIFIFSSKSIIGQEAIDSSRFYYYKIIKPNTEKDLVEGYKYYLNLSDLNLKRKDSLGAIQNLRLVAIAMSRAGLFYESEKTAVDALKLLDAMPKNDSINKEARIALYNHLGIINKELKNYNKAIDYYTRIIESGQTSNGVNSAIKNRANVYVKKGQFRIALNDYLSIYNASIGNTDTLKVARYLDNLGYVQSKLQLTDAYKNLEKSLLLRKHKDYLPGLITSYLHFAEFYHDRNQSANTLLFVKKVNV